MPRLPLESGRAVTAAVPWAEPRGRFTLSFERHVINLRRHCRTVRGAARMARITEDAADGVMRRAVARGMARREPLPLRRIGLDEKAIRKGHRYATILTDIDSGGVIHIAKDRTRESAAELLRRLPGVSARGIEAAAMDMWPAYVRAVYVRAVYVRAVQEALPEALIGFHIKKHLNEALDRVRRQKHRRLSAAGDPVFSGAKYQWLRGHDDLRRRTEAEFRRLLLHDLQTGHAWAVKENFDHFWKYTSLARAPKFLWAWVETARATGLTPLGKAADLIEKHAEGLLSHVWHPITNAAAEGVNSVIQNLKHAARGLPNFESFRTRILFYPGNLDLAPS